MRNGEKRLYGDFFPANILMALKFRVTELFLHIYAVSSGATTFHLAPIFSGYTAAKTLVSPLTGWWSDCRGCRDLILKGEWIGVVITTFTKEVWKESSGRRPIIHSICTWIVIFSGVYGTRLACMRGDTQELIKGGH